nr:hypothetical protein CFP56_28986 [Quercus suber]
MAYHGAHQLSAGIGKGAEAKRSRASHYRSPDFLSLSLFVDPDILRVFSVTRGNDIRERHVLDFELIRSDLFCLFSFLYLDS